MPKVNKLNLPLDDYKGGKSTLCPGCGHDAISSVIMKAAWENSITPDGIAMMSGIGCSSKTPAYFLSQSHGFNTAHGRMPSVTTGANMANKNLNFLAVSGDGDTASIGVGQFIHAIRRNLNMLYIVENNGYAMGTSVARTTSQEDLWKLGEPYEMPSMPVDGMDPVKVAEAIDKCVKHARSGKGPSLLDVKTYRYRGHSLADPDELRSEKEKEFWGKRDPIKKLAKEIIDGKFATEEELKRNEKKIDTEISESVKNALEAPEPPSQELTKYIWAED